jgi:hypothetical protein
MLQVSRAVAERLGQLIPLLCPTTIPDPAAAERVATAVCKFLGPMQGNHVFWRQELAVCQGLGQAIGCFPALCVQLTVLPGLMGSLESSPRVAIAAADALLGYLRECRCEPTYVSQSCEPTYVSQHRRVQVRANIRESPSSCRIRALSDRVVAF